MDYKRHYSLLIASRKKNKTPSDYHERHHIVPKSLGGDNSKSNLIYLTPKEHFVAHLLLAKIHGGKMWAAVRLMSGERSASARGHRVTSRQFDTIRREYQKWAKVYFSENNPFQGKTHTEESKRKLSQSLRDLYSSGDYQHPMKGKNLTPGHVAYMSSYMGWSSKNRHDPDLSIMHLIHKAVGFIGYMDRFDSEKRPIFVRKKSKALRKLSQSYRGINLAILTKAVDKSGENNPNWGNDKVSGEANGRHIDAVWIWKHKYKNKTLECTAYDAYTKHGMSKAGVSECITGKRFGVRNWTLEGAKHPLLVETERMAAVNDMLRRKEEANAVVKCPHCDTKGRKSSSGMLRYHFDKCRFKNADKTNKAAV